MKKLCFGSLLTVLCQIKKKHSQEILYSCLTSPKTRPVDGSLEDKGSVGHRKSGKDDMTEDSKWVFLTTGFDEIKEAYEANLSQCLDEKKYKQSVLALREIIDEDASIPPDETIGAKEYTKRNILNSNKFDYYELIATIMEYVSGIDNSGNEANVKEIPGDFVDRFTDRRNEITLTKGDGTEPCKLDFTIKRELFADTFVEMTPPKAKLDIPNTSAIKLFRLSIRNNEFSKDGLATFIHKNISRYVLSRTKLERLQKDNPEDVTFEACEELRKGIDETSLSKQFEEIMVYSFLECSLSARKIMSGIELENINSKIVSKSEGIYLLPAGTCSNDNQIVFAASNIVSDLKEAIGSAIDEAKTIKERIDDEHRILDPAIIGQIVNDKEEEYIKSIAIPSEGIKTATNDSFGVFISYSVNVPEKDGLSNEDYQKALDAKMAQDLLDAYDFTCSKIRDSGLAAHSFYFFVMPLDDVEKDSKTIMEKSLQGSSL
jgi:hypothetical protein